MKWVTVLVLTSLASTALAVPTTWNGGTDNDWMVAGNWSGGVPGDAVIGDTGSARYITNAGGQITGLNWSQSSSVVSQLTLGSDLSWNDGEGDRVFSNTSGSAANMVLDLNGYDVGFKNTPTMTPMTIETTVAGGTVSVLSGTINTSNVTIGAGVTVQGPETYQNWTVSETEGQPGFWDPESLVLGRVTGPEGGNTSVGLNLSSTVRVGNILIENGSLNVNGGSVQGDVTFDVLSTDAFYADPAGNFGGPHGPYYAGLYNLTNNHNFGLRVGGNWYDPNPLGNYHQGDYEGDKHPLRLQFDGGGHVQTFFTLKNDVKARLQVDVDSHLELNSNFTSTYPVAEAISSGLSSRSTLDLGSYDLSMTDMTLFSDNAENAPTIIYRVGTDSGTLTLDDLVHAGYLNFVIESGGDWEDGDFTLLTYDTWSGIKEFSAESANVTLPPGWSYDAVVVSNSDGGAGTWKLTNLRELPPPPVACDFDGDFSCDVNDLNLMYSENFHNLVNGVATTETTEKFDLVDDDVIDNVDIDEWLVQAATRDGYDSPYRRGDTDNLGNELSRKIDLTDYTTLAFNFSPTATGLNWGQGNFDGDNDIDLRDYNVLASYFNPNGYGAVTASVPEPSCLVSFIFGLTGWLVTSRRDPWRGCPGRG